ncbi:hypothetical protein SAMN03080594_101442 [Arenibacter palladensis]|uniref:Uncharacterized protein n=1 Tax=Arenibacter palladensis TaxID=237373 RepID=A0A1M4U000_9FLAO|nr:hypothetical protein SAMN03080594_101442 [Arenibacter palladensis]
MLLILKLLRYFNYSNLVYLSLIDTFALKKVLKINLSNSRIKVNY